MTTPISLAPYAPFHVVHVQDLVPLDTICRVPADVLMNSWGVFALGLMLVLCMGVFLVAAMRMERDRTRYRAAADVVIAATEDAVTAAIVARREAEEREDIANRVLRTVGATVVALHTINPEDRQAA